MSGLRHDLNESSRLIREGADEIKRQLDSMVDLALAGGCDAAVQIFTGCKLMGCSFVSEIHRLKGLQNLVKAGGGREPVRAEDLELCASAPKKPAAEVWNGHRIVNADMLESLHRVNDHTLDPEEKTDAPQRVPTTGGGGNGA